MSAIEDGDQDEKKTVEETESTRTETTEPVPDSGGESGGEDGDAQSADNGQ